jgi:hypothetical protein
LSKALSSNSIKVCKQQNQGWDKCRGRGSNVPSHPNDENNTKQKPLGRLLAVTVHTKLQSYINSLNPVNISPIYLCTKPQGHFTNETEPVTVGTSSTLIGGEGGSQSKFTSHYVRGTNGACEWKMDVKSTWTPTWHRTDHVSWSFGLFSKSPLGGRPNTKPLGDHDTTNAHNRWFIILFYHGWGPA